MVESFLGRSLDSAPYSYLRLDALTQKVRESRRIVCQRQLGGGHGGKRRASEGNTGMDVGTR